MIEPCQHNNAIADVQVINLIDEQFKMPTGEVRADIKIRCGECNLPYRFVKLPAGYRFDGPTISADFIELRVPIVAPQ